MADIASLLSRLPGGAPGGSPGAAPGGGGGNVVPFPGGAGGGAPGQARPNIGPVTTPQPHAGTMAAAINDIRNAVRMLEKALPQIPMGTPVHQGVLKATTDLLKHLPSDEGNQGLELQSLLQMARQASQSAPLAALSRMGAPAGAPPAMPGGPPGGGAPPAAAAA